MTTVDLAAAPRVAYQGEPGAYGEIAIGREWDGRATPVGAATFPEALALLGARRVDYAVIPVWNSTIGAIQDTNLLLSFHAMRVETVAELTVPVVHCLVALPGVTQSTVRYVGSHPAALAQCRRLFSGRHGGHALQPCVAHDTAGAARELAALGGIIPADPVRHGHPAWFEPYRGAGPAALAAIAAAPAAHRYGLSVLVDGVQDEPSNATRFVILKARGGVHW